MVLQTNEKNKIKFDIDEKQYIYYRILTKSELKAHLAEANKQMASLQNTVTQFQIYIDDERVIEPKEDEPEP